MPAHKFFTNSFPLTPNFSWVKEFREGRNRFNGFYNVDKNTRVPCSLTKPRDTVNGGLRASGGIRATLSEMPTLSSYDYVSAGVIFSQYHTRLHSCTMTRAYG